jgi:hypothetical protein
MGLRIRCAICNRPVDLVEQWRDHPSNAWRLRVLCHGDSDTMEIPPGLIDDAEAMEQIKSQEGVAFATERLPAALASGKERP